MNFEITNASVDMCEYGSQEIEFIIDGKSYIIEFESTESPNKGSRGSSFSVEFRDKKDAKLAKKLGIVLDDELKKEIRKAWDTYSNINFRC